MTRSRHSLALVIVLLLLLVACSGAGTVPGVASVTINEPDLTLLEGDATALTATVVTVGGAHDGVVWTSSAPAVASVGAGGDVVAHAPGAATMTATSAFDATKMDGITVTVPEPLVLVVDTNLDDGTAVSLELTGPLDVKVGWGDGTSSTTTTAGPLPHSYAVEGVYEIRVSGALPHLRLPSIATAVSGWGDVGLESLARAFMASEDLTSMPGALPATVTDLSYAFAGTERLNLDIGGWDVSSVTDMSGMLEGIETFDHDIGGWDVTSASDMDHMFSSAEAFDQDLTGWCVALTPTEPVSFTSLAQTRPLPVWGTCP